MRKTLEKYVLKPFIASVFAASLVFTPLSVCNVDKVFAQTCSQEEVDKRLEDLLLREDKIETRNELRKYLDYGYELYEAEQWEDVIKLNKHAIKLYEGKEHGLWYAYHNIGGAYFNKGEYEDALVWMDKALDAVIQGHYSTNMFLIKYGKALIFYKLKDYKSALENIDESLEWGLKYGMNPPESWYVKALILKDYAGTLEDAEKKKGMLDSALESVENAISGYKYELSKFYYDEEKEMFLNERSKEFVEGLKDSEQLKNELENILGESNFPASTKTGFSFDLEGYKIRYVR